MLVKNKYEYPILERVDMETGRHYLDSNNKAVPSVTTILSGTSKSKDGLIQWRNRVGEEEADRVIKQSTDIGTAVHEAIENYLNGKSWNNFEDTHDQLLAKKISDKFINDGLKGITDIWGLEVGLLLDNLYAGTADCVGEYDGIPTLIDFKTAKKIKKREWIEDYFLQGCAYANAHNVMFGTKIEQIVILMVDRSAVFQEFIVRPTEFNFLTRKWKNRLIEFNNKYNV
jgi:genome maintenance exonuclease 1